MRADENAVDKLLAGEEVMLDMSDIDRELMPDYDSFLTMLRNVDAGSNAKLDFSKVSYEEKVSWLRAYAHTNLTVNVDELSLAWAEVVQAMLGQQIDDVKSIFFTSSELRKFISSDIQLCQDVAQLLHDSMFWAAAVASKTSFDVDDEVKELSPSILSACKHVSKFDFDLLNAFKTCKQWPKALAIENFELVRPMLLSSKACMLLYGQKTPQWQQFKALFECLQKNV